MARVPEQWCPLGMTSYIQGKIPGRQLTDLTCWEDHKISMLANVVDSATVEKIFIPFHDSLWGMGLLCPLVLNPVMWLFKIIWDQMQAVLGRTWTVRLCLPCFCSEELSCCPEGEWETHEKNWIQPIAWTEPRWVQSRPTEPQPKWSLGSKNKKLVLSHWALKWFVMLHYGNFW